MKTQLLILVAGAILVGTPLYKSICLYQDLHRFGVERAPMRFTGVRLPRDWQKKIGEAAARAGIKKLTNLNMDGPEKNPLIQLAWDSSLSTSQIFMTMLQSENLVGPVLRLQMAPSSSSGGDVSAKAIFQSPNGLGSNPKVIGDFPVRPVFASAKKMAGVADSSMPHLRTDHNASRKEWEQKEQVRRAQEEIALLENKKREIESTLVLTGIVNNGRDTMAVVDAIGAQRKLWMVKTGDVINDVRVATIDAARGEVALDYEGKTQVVLRLGTGGMHP